VLYDYAQNLRLDAELRREDVRLLASVIVVDSDDAGGQALGVLAGFDLDLVSMATLRLFLIGNLDEYDFAKL